ncbi:hypothetical protein [Actinoplanes nipponensis]|uniref:hypothetical protein n=1 Tax=Actinoplanes nipponensis TaxID=135950 RepID=UPI0031E5309C
MLGGLFTVVRRSCRRRRGDRGRDRRLVRVSRRLRQRRRAELAAGPRRALLAFAADNGEPARRSWPPS